MKAIIRLFLILLISGFISVIPALAGNTVLVARPLLNVLEVRLANSDDIYSILFTLRAPGEYSVDRPGDTDILHG